MLQVTEDFKRQVAAALLRARTNFTGPDTDYSLQWGINKSVYSQIRAGKTDKLLKEEQWLSIGRKLGVTITPGRLKFAKTDVYFQIEEDVDYCRANSKSMMFVDESEIGKTVSAKYLARHRTNLFYVDASQAKTKIKFIKLLAKTIGVDPDDTQENVKESIKNYLNMLPKPCVIVDEAGDMRDEIFLELKEFWNATEFTCGWYLIGADGLRTKIERGIRTKKPGFRELYSRFASSYSSITPVDINEKKIFYRELIETVLLANGKSGAAMQKIIGQCIKENDNNIGGLRRVEGFLILQN